MADASSSSSTHTKSATNFCSLLRSQKQQTSICIATKCSIFNIANYSLFQFNSFLSHHHMNPDFNPF
ncbi:hypothetical protein RIF29_11630 [Crotalaria pallida]|uniref:Uncharacterized protein n=1 Tax=Crotalaria pallida TaxID=3830 RepID=A0AAN9IMB3_CROPI